MVILGLILLVLGLVLGIYWLTVIGVILIIVGLILWFVPVGGARHRYYKPRATSLSGSGPPTSRRADRGAG